MTEQQMIADDNLNHIAEEKRARAIANLAKARAAKKTNAVKKSPPTTSKQIAPTNTAVESAVTMPLRTEKVQRRRRDTEEEDPFFIDKRAIPDGFSVEWKRISCYGKPETSYLVKLQRQGWDPAPVNMFRQLVGDEYQGKTIDIDGMRLMMRPKSLTDEAREEDYEIAAGNVRNKMNQLQQTENGHLQRKVQVVKRSYERAPIPADE